MAKDTVRLLKNDERYVHGYLNYRRPVLPNSFQPMGPTHGDDPLTAWPVEVSLDGKRVGISYTPPGGESVE